MSISYYNPDPMANAKGSSQINRGKTKHDQQDSSYLQTPTQLGPNSSSQGPEWQQTEIDNVENKSQSRMHNTGGPPKKYHVTRHRLNCKERIKHFTWTWFTMTMATGGVANALFAVPYRFDGLFAIGCVFFILNMVLFIFNVVMISLRFYYYPSTFLDSILHPTESLFVPASLISVATILVNITEYGLYHDDRQWLIDCLLVLFWLYCALAVLFSCGIYLVLWSTQTFTIDQMTPVWIFPAYPLLLVGPFAGKISQRLDGDRALDVIIGGFVLQGTGFMVSLMIYAAFLYRLMTQKLPQESLRPALFISVGPSGFTISGIINMGSNLPRVVPPNFMGEGNGELAGKVSMFVANWAGLWLWGLASWFFLVSIGAHWSVIKHGGAKFSMTFYSYIFPNTALITATFAVGKALGNEPIKIVGCVMSGLLVLAWVIIFSMMFRAVIVKDILWPQKQEDRAEGGWKGQGQGNDDDDDVDADHDHDNDKENTVSLESSEAEVERDRKSNRTTSTQTKTLFLRRGAGNGANGEGNSVLKAPLQASNLCEAQSRAIGEGMSTRRRPKDMV